MKVTVLDIKNAKAPLELAETLHFPKSSYENVATLNEIKDVKVKAKCSNYGDIIEIKLEIHAPLVLQCSYTLEDVDYDVDTEEVLEFSEDPLDEEILEITGNTINIDDYVLGIIIGNIPLKVVKKGAKLPNIKGVKVWSEDEFEENHKNQLDPRLKALDDWEDD